MAIIAIIALAISVVDLIGLILLVRNFNGMSKLLAAMVQLQQSLAFGVLGVTPEEVANHESDSE